MAKLQPIRGTRDLLPAEFRRHHFVIETAREIAERYGYDQMATPIFELTSVFARTLGDTSDVVTKEMYTFEARDGESVTLRPENTAGVARAFISNGLTQAVPCKFFYAGPMFRYERPQKGRYRQLHQIGLELIGVSQPTGDVEVLAAGAMILEALGLKDRVTLELNTLGDSESRDAFRAVLIDYFQSHFDKLSEDSRNRLLKNPLRILDSKDEGDRVLVAGAPSYKGYLNQASQDFFGAVKEGLDRLGITYQLNDRLVRGLDYYCHTAFEFTTTELGAQSAVLAGGRYDGLVGQMGGPETPGVGWAAGIDRMALLLSEEPKKPLLTALVPLGDQAEVKAAAIADDLRRQGLAVDLAYTGNLPKRMKRADKVGAKFAMIFGDDELAKGEIQVKDLSTGEQKAVAIDDLARELLSHKEEAR